jgi:hypothetical protein
MAKVRKEEHAVFMEVEFGSCVQQVKHRAKPGKAT